MQAIYDKRSDLSTFLVHLTRDHEDGTTAQQAFKRILQNKPFCLEAKSPVGLFCRHAHDPANFIDEERRSTFEELLKVVCFTETPLDQIKHFIEVPLENEQFQIKYSEYGFVFSREFIQRNGGNPCHYICTAENDSMKSIYIELFEDLKKKEQWTCKNLDRLPKSAIFRIFPFVNIFGRGGKQKKLIDFYWEREWRIPKKEFTFNAEDVILALCPESEIDDYRKQYPTIKFVSPKWSLQRIIQSLAG